MLVDVVNLRLINFAGEPGSRCRGTFENLRHRQQSAMDARHQNLRKTPTDTLLDLAMHYDRLLLVLTTAPNPLIFDAKLTAAPPVAMDTYPLHYKYNRSGVPLPLAELRDHARRRQGSGAVRRQVMWRCPASISSHSAWRSRSSRSRRHGVNARGIATASGREARRHLRSPRPTDRVPPAAGVRASLRACAASLRLRRSARATVRPRARAECRGRCR